MNRTRKNRVIEQRVFAYLARTDVQQASPAQRTFYAVAGAVSSGDYFCVKRCIASMIDAGKLTCTADGSWPDVLAVTP